MKFVLIMKKLKVVNLKKIGTLLYQNEFQIQMLKNHRIGLMKKKLMIQLIQNQQIGINQNIFLILMLKNPKIGMMKLMVHGNHHKLIIQNIKVFGKLVKLTILNTKVHGFILKLIILNMLKMQIFIYIKTLVLLVSIYGKLNQVLSLIMFLSQIVLNELKNLVMKHGVKQKMQKRK